MVPPALPEVRKPMSETYLHQLKDNTLEPAHLHISNDHHLEEPSTEMSEKVDICNCFIDVDKHARWIFWGVNPAVYCIHLFGWLKAKRGFEKLE